MRLMSVHSRRQQRFQAGNQPGVENGDRVLRFLDIMQVDNISVFRRLPRGEFCQNFAKNGVMHIKNMVSMVKISGT